MRTIVLTGPESSGKTTLCQLLAVEYGTTWVPEQARSYLAALGRPYTYEDLTVIAERQLKLRDVRARRAKGYLFCDTDMLVLKIWALEKYGRVPALIEEALQRRAPDAYLLCAPDIPYEPDPLRESEGRRAYLFALYETALREMEVPFVVVRGTLTERRAGVEAFLARLGAGRPPTGSA